MISLEITAIQNDNNRHESVNVFALYQSSIVSFELTSHVVSAPPQ